MIKGFTKYIRVKFESAADFLEGYKKLFRPILSSCFQEQRLDLFVCLP